MRQLGQQKLLTYLIGSIAVSLSLYALVTNSQNFTIVAASIYFILICYTDCRYNKIPNIINATLATVGIAFNIYIATDTSGALYSLAGLTLGVALLFLPYLAGGFGAGDVKALGALGALLGPYATLHVFAYMGIIGGVLALLYSLFSGRSWNKLSHSLQSITASFVRQEPKEQATEDTHDNTLVRFPYATAITMGYYCFIYRGAII